MKQYTKALANKVKNAAGAPGRFLYDQTKGRHDKYKMDKTNKEVGFIQDYQARKRSGVPNSPQDQAKYQMVKDKYNR